MSIQKDFLGSEISIGDRAIRVGANGHNKFFQKVTVKEIDFEKRFGDTIGIISDGKSKIGWTYPSRIITQKSFNKEI